MPKNHEQIFQDFETVILRNKNARTNLNAKREGRTETIKKPQMSDHAIKMANLDNDNESTKVKTVTRAFSNALRDARNGKGLKQKELASLANIPFSDVQKFENGTAIPNQQQIRKLERKLGVNLSKLNKK